MLAYHISRATVDFKTHARTHTNAHTQTPGDPCCSFSCFLPPIRDWLSIHRCICHICHLLSWNSSSSELSTHLLLAEDGVKCLALNTHLYKRREHLNYCHVDWWIKKKKQWVLLIGLSCCTNNLPKAFNPYIRYKIGYCISISILLSEDPSIWARPLKQSANLNYIAIAKKLQRSWRSLQGSQAQSVTPLTFLYVWMHLQAVQFCKNIVIYYSKLFLCVDHFLILVYWGNDLNLNYTFLQGLQNDRRSWAFSLFMHESIRIFFRYSITLQEKINI